MGDVVKFRAKKLSGFIPDNAESNQPGTAEASVLRGFSSVDVFPTWPWPADTASLSIPMPQSYIAVPVTGRTVDFPPWPDTACSEINPDSGDCA